MSPNYASHAVSRDTQQTIRTERIAPKGFFQTLRAKTARLLDRQEAERRYDFEAANREPLPRVLEQTLTVVLLPKDDEVEPPKFVCTITGKTLFLGSGGCFPADFNLKSGREKVLARAGREGLMLNGAYYPHSRIDRIEPGPVQVIHEGEEHLA